MRDPEIRIKIKDKKIMGIERGIINLLGNNIDMVMLITAADIVATTSELININIESIEPYCQ
jgi:hypothetical protein